MLPMTRLQQVLFVFELVETKVAKVPAKSFSEPVSI
jgi:hypothetical protein